MYIRFSHKASLMASMRKALLVLALMVVMLQMASTPARAEQKSGEQTPPAVQQGSVTLPADNNNGSGGDDNTLAASGGGNNSTINQGTPLVNNPPADNNNGSGGGDNTPAGGGGDDNSSTNQSTPPLNNKGAGGGDNTPAGGAGISVDPVKDPGDTVDTSNQGSILIHCSPVTGCSNENLGSTNDDDKSSSSNSKENPDAPKDEQSSTPEANPKADPPVQPQPGAGEGGTPSVEEGYKGYDSSGIYGPWMKGYGEGGDKGYLADGQAANEEGAPQNGYSSDDVIGCPGNYEYDEDFSTCFPTLDSGDLISYPVLFGDEPLPDSAGGYLGLLGGFFGDTLQAAGAITQGVYGNAVEDALLWYGDPETAGPIGYPIQGLGYTIGFAGDAVGGLLEGTGMIVDGAADGVGAVIDDIGSAAGDALDEISSWF